MKKSKYSGSQIITILKQAESGTPVPVLPASGTSQGQNGEQNVEAVEKPSNAIK